MQIPIKYVKFRFHELNLVFIILRTFKLIQGLGTRFKFRVIYCIFSGLSRNMRGPSVYNFDATVLATTAPMECPTNTTKSGFSFSNCSTTGGYSASIPAFKKKYFLTQILHVKFQIHGCSESNSIKLKSI